MKRRPWRWLPLAFAAVAFAFVSATILTQLKTSAIDEAASEIALSASPSIEVLSSARSNARHLYVLLRERLLLDSSPEPHADETIAAARRQLDLSLEAYFAQAVPGEAAIWDKIHRGRARFDEAIERFEQPLASGDRAGARTVMEGPLTDAYTELSDGIGEAIALGAEHSGKLAFQIRRERETTTRLAVLLDVVCVLLTLLATLAVFYEMRSHAVLVERHQELDHERSVELEQFAGRIAHDILNPLGTVSMALEIVDQVEDAEKKQRALARGRTSIARVKRLVDGLLGFARAGARPEPGAHAAAAVVIADVVDDNRAAAEDAAVELRVEANRVEAACSEGVLTSLVSNLVRNAIKYGGREVVVRASEQAGRALVEVVDHGPGLTEELAARAFEPFACGTTAKGASIGLGLATVRKLASAHGGRVGVHPTPGGGATFWFDLPLYLAGAGAGEAVRDQRSAISPA